MADQDEHDGAGATARPYRSRRATTATAHALLAAFGARPFTNAQVRGIGVSSDQLFQAVTAGKIHRLARGTYVIDEPAQRTLLVHLQHDLAERGSRSVVGGCSAAHIWNIPIVGGQDRRPDCTPMLWVPPGFIRPGVRDGIHFIIGEVPPDHTVTASDGLILTSALRTAVDVVRLARPSLRWALATLSGGLRSHLAATSRVPLSHGGVITRLAQDSRTRERLFLELAAMIAAVPRWGIRTVRDCLAFVDPRLETPLESVSWGRFVEAGISLPEPQAWLQGSSGRWWRVDFWWPQLGLIGEADGMVKYTEAQALMDEKARQLDLEGPGRSVIRWGWSHVVNDHDAVLGGLISRIRAAAS
jgi:hypothetical protein